MTVETPAVPIPCDWPDCTVTRLSIGALAGHFVQRHAVSSSVARERAEKVQREHVKADPYGLDRNGIKTTNPIAEGEPKRPEEGPSSSPRPNGAATGDGRNGDDPARDSGRGTARPHRRGPASSSSSTPSTDVTPPAPKELAMKIDDPIKCADCRESFVREHGRQTKCKKCRGAKGCSYCKRVGEHTAACPRSGKPATKATGGGNGARPSSKKPKPAVRPDVTALSAQIAALVEIAAEGKRAQAELDAIRAALA